MERDTGKAFGTVLRKARALIEAPERWLPSGYAADASGHWRPVGSDDAVRFSLLGAVIRCGARTADLMAAAREFLEPRSPSLYEILCAADVDLSHEQALEVLDILIAGAQEEQGRHVPKKSGVVSRPSDQDSSASLEDLERRLRGLRGRR